MIEYHFHDAEPVIKYLLISVGSSLILIISLLMCGKKLNKSNTSSRPSSWSNGDTIPVHEEPIEIVQETTLESTPVDTQVTVNKGSSPTTAILPNNKEPHYNRVLPSVNTNTEPDKIEETTNVSSQNFNPYDKVVSDKNVQPVFECSGNSDSGNSIYAKVKDVPVREETAYAVVEIKDKNYDFVNGNVVRRKVEIVDEETDKSFSDIIHYDKPNCVGKVEIGEEAENSGTSGIYECVSDSNKGGNVELLSRKSTNDSDLYDFCGPAAAVSHGDLRVNRGNDITDNISNTVTYYDDDVKYDSFNRQLNPQVDIPPRGGSKEVIDESNKCEKKEQEKQSKLSKYLKFNQSTKKIKKTEENHDVHLTTCHIISKDIPLNNLDPNEDKAPPPPSVIKLKHISAHRKGQHSISDKSYSPEPSIGGSSPTSSMNNQPTFIYDEYKGSIDTGVLHTQEELHISHHRPRMSDGNIPIHDLPGGALLKTQNSSPAVITKVVCETVVNNIGNSPNHVHVLQKSGIMNNIHSEVTRDSLISEPDYAEIDTSDNANRHVVIVSENNCEGTKGYTEVSYGNGPLEIVGEGNYDVSKGYAVVDYNKKSEDRRIKNLYAAVDFSSKKPRDADAVDNTPSLPVKYEGTYDIIPVSNTGAAPQEDLYEELTARNN